MMLTSANLGRVFIFQVFFNLYEKSDESSSAFTKRHVLSRNVFVYDCDNIKQQEKQ